MKGGTKTWVRVKTAPKKEQEQEEVEEVTASSQKINLLAPEFGI
jgi:hypothetical protein